MDYAQIVLVIVGLAAVVMAGTGIYIAKKPATVTSVLAETSAALTDIQTAAGAAKEYVAAAEQLWKSGQIQAGDRFDFVLSRLVETFPSIPRQTLEDSIEAGVTWLKMGLGEK